MRLQQMGRNPRRAARSGFTLIELVVAMGIVGILAAVAYTAYSGQTAQAHTHAVIQVLDQIRTGIDTFRALSPSGGYPEAGNPPSDTVNADSATNTGAASYAALLADLQTVSVNGLPTGTAGALPKLIDSWSYRPMDGTAPPTYTVTATATGGTGDVLCIDPTNGVVDIGVGAQPASPGVLCR